MANTGVAFGNSFHFTRQQNVFCFFEVLFYICVCGLFAALGLHLLGCLARTDPKSSFYTLADKAIPKYKKAVDFVVAIKCFGVATSYPIVTFFFVTMGKEFSTCFTILFPKKHSQFKEYRFTFSFTNIRARFCKFS